MNFLMAIRKTFSAEIEDFAIVIYLLGIKITSSLLYKIIYGDPLRTNCSIIKLNELKRNGTMFPHPVGIVISPEAVIGKNCTIHQNVTIGTGGKFNECLYPTIGDNVIIYTGAVVIGGITIEDNAIIAANSVVRTNVKKNTLVAGVPAKFIKKI